MANEISFGVGSFHFGVRKKPPFKFSGAEYIQELKDALSKIANLNNLNVQFDDDFLNYTEDVVDELPILQKKDGYFPQTTFLDVEFELYIPFRIQSTLCDTEVKFLTTYTERFKVRVCERYYFPVVIIESIAPTSDNSPSTAIRIVREFLKQELSEAKSNYIKFEFLGPSPFHIDCYINKDVSNAITSVLRSEEVIERGYDSIMFYYNPKLIQNGQEALEYLLDTLADEFGYCYQCIQFRVEKMYQWGDIEKSLNKLQKIQNLSGIDGFYNRLFVRPGIIGKLFADLTDFEAKDITVNSIYQNNYKELYKSTDEMFFKNFIDKEIEEKYTYPVKQVTELVKFYEGRRVKSIELIFVVIAAILGGLVGSLFTSSSQNNSSTNTSSKPPIHAAAQPPNR